MRWSMWPVSIVVHVLLVTAALIVPLTADGDPPTPVPMHALRLAAIETVRVPPEVLPMAAPIRGPRVLPNVFAPDVIAAEPDEPPPQPGVPTTEIRDGLAGPGFDAFGTTGVADVPSVPPPPVPEPPVQKIVRVGPGIREPRRVAGGPPAYPLMARNARVQGTVILEAVINDRGAIERVRVLRSVPLLDAAAIAAVQNWRYTPTLLNGVPVSVLMTITINFTLQD
jgi:periplasmic protein TonB